MVCIILVDCDNPPGRGDPDILLPFHFLTFGKYVLYIAEEGGNHGSPSKRAVISPMYASSSS